MAEANINTGKPCGVIGAGSFGTAITKLLAENVDVLLYSRKQETVDAINKDHLHNGVKLPPRIKATADIAELAHKCHLIFPIVPSVNFRSMMREISPHLRPYHVLIHGTKGFGLTGLNPELPLSKQDLSRENVHTMSEIILEESVVVRVGCLSGPNLSAEIMAGKPTATVIGSKFNEVIKLGRRALDSNRFHVFGTHEILGAEVAGALKNCIAIGSGILEGLQMGRNIQSMLLTRGLTEMVHLGKAMGASSHAFIGTAGIGDLVATCFSQNSRNFTFGMRMAKGESLEEIKANMPELAEGVRSIEIMNQLSKFYKLHTPITRMLYSVVFQGFDIERAMDYLMKYPYAIDVDFL